MNQFTVRNVSNFSDKQKQELVDQDTACKHVEKAVSLAYTLHSEVDSHGPVSTHVNCKECSKKAEEEVENEEHVCHDCKQSVKMKDGYHWKWYDFYAAQGDEPLFICDVCAKEPTHRQRVARDRADYEAEFGTDDNDD